MDFILDDIFQSLKPLLDDSQENPQTLAASRLAGLYGILCCFNLFGYDILAQFVLPNMSALCKHLNQMMKREQTLKLSFGCNAPANNFRMQFRAERIAFGRVQHYLIVSGFPSKLHAIFASEYLLFTSPSICILFLSDNFIMGYRGNWRCPCRNGDI